MVNPLQNKTRDQLMAEFDAVFGSYNLTPLQNPNTYRRIGLGIDKSWVIIPEEIKISQIISDLGRPLGERYLLILSNLYVRGLYHKKKPNSLGNFFPLHRDELMRLGGDSYLKLLRYGLTKKHLIKSPKQFVIGLRSNEYMLNQKILSLKAQQRYQLTTKAAVRIRMKHADERKQKFINEGSVYRKIADSIDRLTFDYSAAIKYVATLADGDKRAQRRNVVEQFILDDPIWAIDRQGRNYTVMVSVPRDLRRFFRYGNQTLYVVDITSSQPLLHVHLYPTESGEKKRYLSIVQGGKFWEFMNDAAGKPFDLPDDDDDKAELKETVYQQIFFAYREPRKGATGTFAVIFKRGFPILWSAINASKMAKGPKQSGPLARLMQQTEAEIVAEAIRSLKDKPYPLISIHDAIVTTKDGLADVEQALKQSFLPANLSPRLAVKQLTV